MEKIMLSAAKGMRPDVTPVWIEVQMLVLPEHRQLAEKYGFGGIVKNAELAARSTVMPVEELDVDAAILFSDLLVPAEAMGVEVVYSLKGPSIPNPVRTSSDVDKLIIPDPEKGMKTWLSTIKMSKIALRNKAPVIGWVGAPFQMASFMVEGGSSASFRNIKRMMYESPSDVHKLFTKLSEMAVIFLNAQIKSGAEIAMLFDIVAGFISPKDYEEFCYPYIKNIAYEIKKTGVPLIYHSRGSNFLEFLGKTDVSIVGLDWSVDISRAIQILGAKKVVQGNLEPYILFGPEELIKTRTEQILKAASSAPAHIFSLGGWIIRDTPVEKAKYLIDLVHKYKI